MEGKDPVSRPLLDGERRDVYDHDKFDFDLLQEQKNLDVLKKWWKFYVETAIATWVLVSAVSTIMLICFNFEKSVAPEKVSAFGEDEFANWMAFIKFYPLVFFVFLLLLYNNLFSERVFYKYLRYGAIVDYVESAAVGWLLKHPIPLFCVLLMLFYVVTAVSFMVKFDAPFGTIIILLNNMLIGVMGFWYRQQSIEWKFISLSWFIQGFENRDGKFGETMDEHSLNAAASLLQRITLIKSQSPSYTGYMRKFWLKSQRYNPMVTHVLNALFFFIVVLFAGLTFAYFYFLSRQNAQAVWNGEINPCANVCYNTTLEMGGTLTPTVCSGCICRCLSSFNMRARISSCGDYFNPFYTQCGKHNCPQSCGFSK